MGKKSTPSSPPPIDVAAQAKVEGAANLEASRLGFRLNNPDQVTPFGERRVTPMEGQSDRFQITDTLNPEQQAIVDADARASLGLSNLAASQTERLQGTMDVPFDPTSELPSGGTAPTAEGISPLPGQGLRDIPGSEDFGAERSRVEDALVGRFNRFTEPNLSEDRESLMTRLSNQGHAVGGGAYGKAMDRFDRRADATRADVRDQAVAAGGAEQSRLFADALSARGTQFGEQAQRQAADLGQQSQLFGMGQGARERALQERLAIRNQPINEIAALIGTGQVNLPQFAGLSTQQVAPANIFGMNQMNQNRELARFNARAAAQRANIGATAGILGAGAMGAGYKLMSHRSFKDRVGETSGVLDNLIKLDVDRWKYKPKITNDQATHIGPYAEDFKEAFGVGDGVHIDLIDAIGVLFAAMKELTLEIREFKEFG
jgi:hypothetical protein